MIPYEGKRFFGKIGERINPLKLMIRIVGLGKEETEKFSGNMPRVGSFKNVSHFYSLVKGAFRVLK